MESKTNPSVPGLPGRIAPSRSSWPRPKHLLFAFIGLLIIYVILNNERFLIDPKHPEWQHIEPFKWWLLPHGLAAACVLFLGPLQFSDRLRLRFVRLHRLLGRLYVVGVFIGAPLGLYIAYFAERLGGTRSGTVTNAVDAVLLMLTTGIALVFILKGKVQEHRQWMTRSYACALIFVEVRVIIGITGWDKYLLAIIWTCVAAAIPLADMVLQWQDLHRARRS